MGDETCPVSTGGKGEGDTLESGRAAGHGARQSRAEGERGRGDCAEARARGAQARAREAGETLACSGGADLRRPPQLDGLRRGVGAIVRRRLRVLEPYLLGREGVSVQ